MVALHPPWNLEPPQPRPFERQGWEVGCGALNASDPSRRGRRNSRLTLAALGGRYSPPTPLHKDSEFYSPAHSSSDTFITDDFPYIATQLRPDNVVWYFLSTASCRWCGLVRVAVKRAAYMNHELSDANAFGCMLVSNCSY